MSEDIVRSSLKLRNARACEACRASKSRCLFRDSQRNVCNKCDVSGSPCIVRSKARPMRAKNSRGPNGSSKTLPPIESHPEFSMDLPMVAAPDLSRDIEELHRHHRRVVLGDEVPEARDLRDEPEPAVFEPRKLGLGEAEALLSTFRGHTALFPFILIPPDATVATLSRTSPFLLLAVFTVASVTDTALNHQLDHEFRRILSLEVIVKGQKSLDLLQGMLAYIAWCPIHSKSRGSQSLLYMNMAITLAIDLGLDSETPDMQRFRTFNTQGLIEDGIFTNAAKSAYLACYCLSASLSTGFRKPTSLKYQNLMNAHTMSLLQTTYPVEIDSLVRLQHLIERISQSQNLKGSAAFSHTIEMSIQIFLNELLDWRVSTLDEVRSLPHVALAENFISVAIYGCELGFLRRGFAYHAAPTCAQHHLMSCLSASKIFFEALLSLPESTYLHFSVLQYGMMVQAIIVLSRLTFSIARVMRWDSATTRSNIPLVMYLDALCYRFQALSSTPPSATEKPRDPDVLYVFKIMLSSVKDSYNCRVADIQPAPLDTDYGRTRGPRRGRCPMFDPGLKGYLDHDLETTYEAGWEMNGNSTGDDGSTPESTPLGLSPSLYHDLWATMTGSWAMEN